MHGPDRLPVRRPEGAEVVPATEGRPGPRHRGGVERVPHPERGALAERAARPVPDGVAVLPVPRRVAGVEPVRHPPKVADRDVRRQEAVERPASRSAGRRPGQVNAITCPVACTPASVRPAPSTRTPLPVAEAGQRGFELPLDRPRVRLDLEAGEVRAVVFDRAR